MSSQNYIDRVRTFRALMGNIGSGDPRDKMTDEEYGEYLEHSETFHGRLWANYDSQESLEFDDSEASTWSIGDLYESYLCDELEDPGSPIPSTSRDNQPVHGFAEDALSSTFIIDDPELMTDLSQDEYFDMMEDSMDYGEEALIQLIVKDTGIVALEKPVTNPCA